MVDYILLLVYNFKNDCLCHMCVILVSSILFAFDLFINLEYSYQIYIISVIYNSVDFIQ